MKKDKDTTIVEITSKINTNNSFLLDEIHSLGFNKIKSIEIKKIYSLTGSINKNKILFISKFLLTDPISETFKILTKNNIKNLPGVALVNIWYKPQVLDVESIYIVKGIKYLGFKEELEVHSGKQIVFSPKVDKKTVSFIIEKIFMNPLIQYYEII
jgi:phosphoribosylformylglycinamidine (FGAM) synthase PurS component